jgi:hypothetical protein
MFESFKWLVLLKNIIHEFKELFFLQFCISVRVNFKFLINIYSLP